MTSEHDRQRGSRTDGAGGTRDADSSPMWQRPAGVQREYEEIASAKRVRDALIKHGFAINGQALANHVGISRTKVGEYIGADDGEKPVRRLPRHWDRLYPLPVREDLVRADALDLGYELTPLTAAADHPHDSGAIAKELCEAVSASVAASQCGTAAGREHARRELREAQQTIAAALNALDIADAEARRLRVIPAAGRGEA